MLAGNGPPVGTGSERAGTPARLTGKGAARDQKVVPVLERRREDAQGGGDEEIDLGEYPLEGLLPGTLDPPGRLDGALVEGSPELQSAAHAVADSFGVLRHQRGVGMPGLDDQQEARLEGGVVPARDGQSRQSHPTSPRARSSAAVMAGSASMGNRPTTRSASSWSPTLKPGSSNSIPVTSPATVRAMGPTVSKLGARGQTPSSGIRPQVVFRPAVPQQAAGMRMDHRCRCRKRRRPHRWPRRPLSRSRIPRDAAGVERVDRRPVPLVHAGDTQSQLVQVGPADDPGARLPGAGQAGRVARRRHGPLRHGTATCGRGLPRHVDEVLDGEADAGSRRLVTGDEGRHPLIVSARRARDDSYVVGSWGRHGGARWQLEERCGR